MSNLIRLYIFLVLVFLFSCKSKEMLVSNLVESKPNSKFELNAINKNQSKLPNDSTFVNIKDYSSDFIFDMKYATLDNFLKSKVYDCAECYLRYKTAKALIIANDSFRKIGLKIKFFDCYRPHDVQVKMWSIVSDANYVANPAKGSIHNKGCAVDITLVDKNNNELDMGTKFDFFGEKASHKYNRFSEKILKNRKKLKEIMKFANFNSFDSEWWHYNLATGLEEKISNFKWKCN